MKLKYLIIGTGRSGTGYMSELFKSIGMKSTHEGMFTSDGWKYVEEVYKSKMLHNIEVESSWMAAPFLDKEKLNGTVIIHVTRNPLKTISSILSTKLLSDDLLKDKRNPFTLFIQNHMPKVFNYSNEVDRTVYFYIYWNKLIERYADLTFKVEDKPDKLFEKLKIDINGKELFTNTKHNNKQRDSDAIVSYNEIPNDALRQKLKIVANKYGYD
jgi:hypothetical protein